MLLTGKGVAVGNERSRSPQGTGPDNLGHQRPSSITSPSAKMWVIAEAEGIDEARAARLLLWSWLGLRGHRHHDHPEIWNERRVRRLELRRGRKGAA